MICNEKPINRDGMEQKEQVSFHSEIDDAISGDSTLFEFPVGTLESGNIETDLKPAMTTLLSDIIRANPAKCHLQDTETRTCGTREDKKAEKSQKRYYHLVTENKNYFVPREFDVKLGRGGNVNNHKGNQMYSGKMLELQQSYWDATSDEKKTSVSQALVNAVHEWGGRFLKEDECGWYEVPNIVARKKASASLCGRSKAKSNSKV